MEIFDIYLVIIICLQKWKKKALGLLKVEIYPEIKNFKPLLFVLQMTFSPRIVEVENYPGNRYISHLCKRKNNLSTVFLGRDMSLPPPKKKKVHLAGTGLVLRQFFEAFLKFR